MNYSGIRGDGRAPLLGHHNNKRMAVQLRSAWVSAQHGNVSFFIFIFFLSSASTVCHRMAFREQGSNES
jgi:hypothetical protein